MLGVQTTKRRQKGHPMAIKLSDGEKLILLMLCELQEKLNIKSETDTKLVKEAIFSGNVWGARMGNAGRFSRT